MMKKDDKWSEQIRKRMEGYTEPLPVGLWDELEKELSSSNPVKVIPLWRRWQSVAAAVAAVAAFSIWSVWFWTTPDVGGKVASEMKQVAESLAVLDEEVNAPVKKQSHPILSNKQDKSYTKPQNDVILSKEAESMLGQGVQVVSERIELEADKAGHMDAVSEIRQEDEASDKRLLAERRRKTDRQLMEENSRMMKSRSYHEKKKWSVGLAVGNAPYGSSTSVEGITRFAPVEVLSSSAMSDVLMQPVSGEDAAFNQLLFNNRGLETTTNIQHKIPVVVGASVRWDLGKKWALESGLCYTLLSSDLSSGAQSYMKEEQKLHYLGVPLKLQRNLLDNRWLTVYLSAGGMIEKCVSAKQTSIYVNQYNREEYSVITGMQTIVNPLVTSGSDSEFHYSEGTSEQGPLSERPWQFSVSAAAGIQVNFTSLIGLYAEPGIAYYFDDNSSLKTIRKEHSCNFNLQVGLRFNLNK